MQRRTRKILAGTAAIAVIAGISSIAGVSGVSTPSQPAAAVTPPAKDSIITHGRDRFAVESKRNGSSQIVHTIHVAPGSMIVFEPCTTGYVTTPTGRLEPARNATKCDKPVRLDNTKNTSWMRNVETRPAPRCGTVDELRAGYRLRNRAGKIYHGPDSVTLDHERTSDPRACTKPAPAAFKPKVDLIPLKGEYARYTATAYFKPATAAALAPQPVSSEVQGRIEVGPPIGEFLRKNDVLPYDPYATFKEPFTLTACAYTYRIDNQGRLVYQPLANECVSQEVTRYGKQWLNTPYRACSDPNVYIRFGYRITNSRGETTTSRDTVPVHCPVKLPTASDSRWAGDQGLTRDDRNMFEISERENPRYYWPHLNDAANQLDAMQRDL